MNAARWWIWVLPELRQFAPHLQAQALRDARDTALDVLELIGMAAGVVLVTALTRYVLPDPTPLQRLMTALLNIAVALPLLAVALAPFHIRRLRRGLRHLLALREGS